MNNQIQGFLKRFHEHKDIDIAFTNGCCYWFSLIMHSRFPNSIIMYDQIQNHFVTQIEGKLYDITGDVTDKYNVIPWDSLDDDLLRQRIIRDCINF